MLSSQEEPRAHASPPEDAKTSEEAASGTVATADEAEGAAIDVTARDRLLYAALFALIEDGLVASSTTWRAHAGAGTSLLAGVEAACFLALPFALAAAPVAWLLDRPSSIALGRHLRAGLGADKKENEGAGVVLFALALALAAAFTWSFGMRIGELQSVRVAVTATVAVAILMVAASGLVASFLAKPVGWVAGKLGKRVPKTPVWLPVPGFIITIVGVAAMYVFLPPSHAITPAAALVGFVVGPEIGSRVALFQSKKRLSAVVLLLGALVLTSISAFSLNHLSDAARLGVLSRAPYASLLITSMRRAVDRDHDGYSAILGGGDCDDHNPDIHPNAIDIPDNGIDENCSGADAKTYKPAPQPPVVATPIPGAPPHYNIVLIHVDALRPDHLSMNGYKRLTSPKLDQFKSESTWFRNAYTAAPSTRFTMSQMFTGLEVARIPQKRGTGVDFWLLPEAVTLAERLTPLGYDRVGYTLSYVLQHVHDIGQGFRKWETPWNVNEWKETYHNSAQLTTDAAIGYLKTVPQDGTVPYMLFLHYGCVHDPYIKHGTWDYGDAPVDLYDSALTYCDDQLGRLIETFKARQDDKNTAIFIFSDHGELFGEHGFTKHGNSLFQPDIRVLLLARIPGATPMAIDTPMNLTDLFPTIEHLTGLPRDPASQAWDLMPYIEGAPMPARNLYFYGDLWRSGVHYEERALLAPDGEMKFIHDISNNISLLLDVKRDPDELSNLSDAQPALASQMAETLDSWDAYESAGEHWEDTHKEKDAKKAAEEREKEKDKEKDKEKGGTD
jgi:arylsulfatase A-like enzyme